jgi:hypothetical protein
MGSSQRSQTPKVPSSMRASAFSIFLSRNFSRSRRRNTIDWAYSLEARSISSGRSSVSKFDSSMRVFLALSRRADLLSSSIFL